MGGDKINGTDPLENPKQKLKTRHRDQIAIKLKRTYLNYLTCLQLINCLFDVQQINNQLSPSQQKRKYCNKRRSNRSVNCQSLNQKKS